MTTCLLRLRHIDSRSESFVFKNVILARINLALPRSASCHLLTSRVNTKTVDPARFCTVLNSPGLISGRICIRCAWRLFKIAMNSSSLRDVLRRINPTRKKETRCVSEPLSDRSVSGPTDEDHSRRLGREGGSICQGCSQQVVSFLRVGLIRIPLKPCQIKRRLDFFGFTCPQ